MNFKTLSIQCDNCQKIHTEPVSVRIFLVENYQGTILKSFWCQHCGAPQVIRYGYLNDKIYIGERLEASSIYVQREPDKGLTIKPRAGYSKG